MIISEWGGWECTLVIASSMCGPRGGGGDHPLRSIGSKEALTAAGEGCPAIEAIPICTSIFVCQFLLAFGPGLAANVRVGNLLGEGRPLAAQHCAKVALAMAMALQAVLTCLIISFRDCIASAFVEDPIVHEHTVRLLPYTTAYSFLATAVSGFSQQLLFALGTRLRLPAALNFFAFFAVGLPAGALLGFNGLEERGIWLGLIVALLIALTGQYAYLLLGIDWEVAAKQAQERALADTKATGTCGESDKQGLAMADSAKQPVETAV
jgi:multidrug resistance protein, MATE family